MEKTGHQLALMLMKIHTHGELCRKDEIVYREKDIIRFLKELGYPEPDFKSAGKALKMLGEGYPDAELKSKLWKR
jgi:hypothetical protein